MVKKVISHNLQNIYILSYIILLSSTIIRNVNIYPGLMNVIFKLGLLTFFLINICLFFVNKYRWNYYSKILLILILIVVLGKIFSFKLIPIELIMLLVLLANINLMDIHKFIYADLITKIAIFSFIAILAKENIISNIYTKGYGLGFVDSDIAGCIVLSIIASLLLLYSNKKGHNVSYHNYWIFVICLILIISFYYITRFRSLLIIGVLIFIFLFLINMHIGRRISYRSLPILSFVIPMISIWIAYAYNPMILVWSKVNKLLSNRLIMQHIVIQDQTLKWCGQHVLSFMSFHDDLVLLGFNSISGISLDNFYLATAYYEGIVGLLILIFIIIKIMFIAKRFHEYIPMVILFSLIVCSCVASGMLNSYNFPVMLYIIGYAVKKINIKKLKES